MNVCLSSIIICIAIKSLYCYDDFEQHVQLNILPEVNLGNTSLTSVEHGLLCTNADIRVKDGGGVETELPNIHCRIGSGSTIKMGLIRNFSF